MTPGLLLILMTCFFLKHFIVDFSLQGPYQYKNKGIYGHPGGILHALFHACGTVIIVSAITRDAYLSSLSMTIDFVVHYHVDWAKMKINKVTGWTPTNSEEFWILLGLDQLLHYLTYAGICWLIIQHMTTS